MYKKHNFILHFLWIGIQKYFLNGGRESHEGAHLEQTTGQKVVGKGDFHFIMFKNFPRRIYFCIYSTYSTTYIINNKRVKTWRMQYYASYPEEAKD